MNIVRFITSLSQILSTFVHVLGGVSTWVTIAMVILMEVKQTEVNF